MKEGQPIPYSPQQRKEVARMLQIMDGHISHELIGKLIQKFLGIYGCVNFAEIESICREYRLQTSFLALPWTDEMSKANPEVMIVNPNNHQEVCTFEALVCKTPENVQYYAEMYGVTDYEPKINFIRLENAGIAIPKPGTELSRFSKAHLN